MKVAIEEILIEDATPDINQEQLQGIADSFKEIGQSHPVILRPANNLGTIKYILASGEKRLLAAKLLGWTEIEADVREMTPDEGKVLKIHENVRRFNLPWWDQVLLVEQLHSLRQAEHGVAKRGRPTIEASKQPEKQGWSLRDTAEELGMGVGPLSEDLSLARALRLDPTLSKVEDKKTATRLARVILTRQTAERDALAPKFETLKDEVYHGDSNEVLKQLPANSIDHAITDPPWIKFFDPSLTIDERTVPVFKELYRVLKPGSMLYLFCGLDDYDYYAGHTAPNPENPQEKIKTKGKLEEIGFEVSNTPVIWQKLKSLSRRGVRPWEYGRDFEFIIVAAKGAPALSTSRQLSGIKPFDIVHPSRMIHANEKPVELLEDIITDCSYEGNIICDPFGGSGVLGTACKNTKRHYMIIERDKKFYDGICKRLGKKS